MFRRRPGRLLNALCTFSLRPVSMGRALIENTTHGWNQLLRVDLAIFQEAAFTMCGNLNKVFSTENSPQLTFRFTWPA